MSFFKRGLIVLLMALSVFQGLRSAEAKGGGSRFSPDQNPIPNGMEAKRSWTDLAYASLSSSQKLDLYLPSVGSVNPYPLILYIHGGGFSGGDKQYPINNGLVAQWLAAGYAVASINYRLSGEAPFPAAIQDAKAAVRWLRAHASGYFLDTANFGAWGDSAGANIASVLGTSCGASGPLEGSSLGNAGESSCVQAVVDWFGPTDFLQMDAQSIADSCNPFHDQPGSPESRYLGAPIQSDPALAARANPITYVDAGDPPFFIQHGTLDCTVPYQQSQLLYDALEPVIGNTKVTLQLLSGAGHEDSQFFSSSNVDLVLDFLDLWLK